MRFAIAVVAAVLLAATPAAAHVGVKSFSPARGASVPRSLETVKVTFKARITDGKLVVRNANGTKVSKGEGSVINEKRALRARLDGGLSKGRYTAKYSVLNTDGHVITKSWSFNLK